MKRFLSFILFGFIIAAGTVWGLPTSATKVHLDQSTDDPKQARGELESLVDKFNQLLTDLGNLVELDIGDGLKNDAGVPNKLTLDFAATPGLEISAGKLQAKVGPSMQRTGNGLEVDISGLTEDTSPDAANDFILTHDTSAGGKKKVKIGSISSTGGMQVFTSSGTWSTPPGISTVLVEQWGAGGGGAGAFQVDDAGGGGGGQYKKFLLSVSGNITVTVGTGGAGGIGRANGSAGGNTSFNVTVSNGGGGGVNSTLVGSGSGGTGGGGGDDGGATVLAKRDGDAGETDVTSNIGGDGGYSGMWSTGGLMYPPTGATAAGIDGSAGINRGDGGGGAAASGGVNQTGGAGANGLVIVYW